MAAPVSAEAAFLLVFIGLRAQKLVDFTVNRKISAHRDQYYSFVTIENRTDNVRAKRFVQLFGALFHFRCCMGVGHIGPRDTTTYRYDTIRS